MMKKKSMSVILMGLMMFTSCSLSAVNEAQETNVTVVAESQVEEEIAAKEVAESQVEEETAVKDEAETQVPEEVAKEEATTKDATETKIEDDTVIKNEMASASDVKGTREMTEEELQAMSEWVSNIENSGFFLSSYEDPRYADYDCVYYDGAGISCDDYSEKELMDDYFKIKKVSKEEEEFARELDIISIRKQDIVKHLQEKVGLNIEDIKFDWVYSPNYDLYYSIHSDCYAVGYKCLEGTITINENGEEIDTIKLTSPISIDDPQRPIVTLKKTGDGYRILSCVYIEEK